MAARPREVPAMRRRKRNPDKYKLGRSSIVPYIASESWETRHRRRKDKALLGQPKVEKWCAVHKWRLRINNNGHHWIFNTHQGKMIEWFPSTGKLVVGKSWKQGIHCHDVEQLLETLEETL